MKYSASLSVPPQALLKVDLDILLNYHLSQIDPQEFFLVQVGAYDGTTNDPVHDYLVRYGWKSLLIEPQVQSFERLKSNYSAFPQTILLNLAISESDGIQDFYQVVTDNPMDWSTQIASLDRNHLIKHRNSQTAYGITTSIPDIEDKIAVKTVECLSFDSLLTRFRIQRIDLLQIDAEGYDDRLVLSFPFERLKPAIIRYENMHLDNKRQETCLAFLMEQGYRIGFEFADTIAYHG